jgi:hypothetical protein
MHKSFVHKYVLAWYPSTVIYSHYESHTPPCWYRTQVYTSAKTRIRSLTSAYHNKDDEKGMGRAAGKTFT